MPASSSSYRRVPQRDSDDEISPGAPAPPGSESEFSSPSSTRSRGERLEDKCIALGWVIVAFLVARWTNFFAIVWSDQRLNRTLLGVAFWGFVVVISLFLYLTVYLPKVKGLSDPSVWNVYCPKVLPLMCVTGLATYFVFVRAIWPLWGFFAPLVSGTEIMGILMAFHFVPTFGRC
mmetsp:Transcript_4858/g.10267  ORF Transcript_4858/g.10267 Transcript_4858/m.10267 type:complete len:176 (+) Transcript_4858:260-787(+)|eukprot:CAMPEP_0201117008 /NCGR_PEP_ID=MMETSP0850-20130426/1129_1 /ASSEMBLY_ACC=CAM_ASM_000622 /TAXON_ID=183588 /ORGANISM="Pseudo-nitzschia fraudulenta, Strain WWA7" /LENGTH=175 /DNA_ID=CAMNT_0047381245 /DNA_START=239 /DNA_END=766 /DNA_ORIENTATION=+